MLQPADFVQANRGFDVLQQSGPGQGAALAGQHVVDVLVIEAAVIVHALMDDAGDLLAVQAQQVAQDGLPGAARDSDFQGGFLVGRPQRGQDDLFDFQGVRERDFERGCLHLDDLRELVFPINHDQLAAGLVEVVEQVPQNAQRAFLPQMGRQVKRHADGPIGEPAEVQQAVIGAARLGQRWTAGQQAVLDAAADRPEVHQPRVVKGRRAHQAHGVLLLKRDDRDARLLAG